MKLTITLCFCIYLCQAQTTFEKHIITQNNHGFQRLCLLDFESDGDLDIVSTSWSPSYLSLFVIKNNGAPSPSFTMHPSNSDISTMRFSVGDLNNDGYPDIANAGPVDFNVYISNAPNYNFTKINLAPQDNMTRYYGVDVVDLDKDGDMDVLSAMNNFNQNVDDGKISWWENVNTNPITLVERVLFTNLDIGKVVKSDDFDQDGDVDILGMTSGLQDDVMWWENTANSSSFVKHMIDYSFQGAEALSVADLDGDGDNDVVGSNDCWDETSWWEQTPTGSFIEHPISQNFRSHSVPLADLDRDGDIDIVGAAAGAGIVWWENAGGNPLELIRHDLTTGSQYEPYVEIGDMDGDSDYDIAATYTLNDEDYLVWFENTKNGFSGLEDNLQANSGLKIWPNPTLNRKVNCLSVEQIQRVVVYDMTGKVLMQFEPDAPMFQFEIPASVRNTMFAKFETAKGTRVEKIICK